MLDKILIAIDTSDMSQSVMAEALAIARTQNAQVMILHVLSPVEEGYPSLPIYPGVESYYPTLYDEVTRTYTQKVEEFAQSSLQFVQGLAEKAIAQNIPTEINQQSGDPGRTICAVARHWEASLIVLGRRGRTGLSELVLGSVSNYVLHHAPCSVLVVQGQKQQNLQSSSEQVAVALDQG